MQSLDGRVRKLESQLNAGEDWCSCGFRILWPDGSTLGSQPCDVCGRQRIVMRVVYDSDSRNQSQN
jgi:hypothetical protein